MLTNFEQSRELPISHAGLPLRGPRASLRFCCLSPVGVEKRMAPSDVWSRFAETKLNRSEP